LQGLTFCALAALGRLHRHGLIPTVIFASVTLNTLNFTAFDVAQTTTTRTIHIVSGYKTTQNIFN
jgi:hypothetical protein